MSVTENMMKQLASAGHGVSNDARRLQDMCDRLLREQPESGPLLQRLLARSRPNGRDHAFAPIEDNRCSACNMAVASAQLQKVKAGRFINCAHCSIFLYQDQR